MSWYVCFSHIHQLIVISYSILDPINTIIWACIFSERFWNKSASVYGNCICKMVTFLQGSINPSVVWPWGFQPLFPMLALWLRIAGHPQCYSPPTMPVHPPPTTHGTQYQDGLVHDCGKASALAMELPALAMELWVHRHTQSLMKDCSIYNTNALEILQSCTKLSNILCAMLAGQHPTVLKIENGICSLGAHTHRMGPW